MNLTRVQIDNDLVRFKVLQPRNRRKKESDEGSSRQWPRQIQGITAKESQKNESHEGSNLQWPRQIQGITAKESQKIESHEG